MECNKDEAFRAKEIAEKKLLSQDFFGARKFILKAQQLYPEIDNISQLISVCDVHCSAKNMFGTDLDWYGILQVEQTADETLIKKQYRKFALLLHPDKNPFSGAEAAFKLIGEAQRVLLDKEKRALHDMRRKTTYKPVIPCQTPQQQASKNVGVASPSKTQNNFPNKADQHVSQRRNSDSDGSDSDGVAVEEDDDSVTFSDSKMAKLPTWLKSFKARLEDQISFGFPIPSNPFFVDVIMPYHLYSYGFMRVPKEFACTYWNGKCKKVMVELPDGRRRGVQCVKSGRNFFFKQGWPLVALLARLKLNDLCFLELIDDRKCVLKLHAA